MVYLGQLFAGQKTIENIDLFPSSRLFLNAFGMSDSINKPAVLLYSSRRLADADRCDDCVTKGIEVVLILFPVSGAPALPGGLHATF